MIASNAFLAALEQATKHSNASGLFALRKHMTQIAEVICKRLHEESEGAVALEFSIQCEQKDPYCVVYFHYNHRISHSLIGTQHYLHFTEGDRDRYLWDIAHHFSSEIFTMALYDCLKIFRRDILLPRLRAY